MTKIRLTAPQKKLGGPVKKTKPATIEGARIMYVTTDEVKAETDAVGVSQVADTEDDPILVPVLDSLLSPSQPT